MTSVLAARNRRVRGKNEDSRAPPRRLRHLAGRAPWRAPPEPQSAPRGAVVSWRTRGLCATLFAALIAPVARAEPYDHGLLWRIDKPGVAPSYVFATLHSADPLVTALTPPVARAFASCRTFATEVYPSDVADARFFEAMQFDDGRRLEPLLGADGYSRLKLALGDTAPADDVLARTKPWAALLRPRARPTLRAADATHRRQSQRGHGAPAVPALARRQGVRRGWRAAPLRGARAAGVAPATRLPGAARLLRRSIGGDRGQRR